MAFDPQDFDVKPIGAAGLEERFELDGSERILVQAGADEDVETTAMQFFRFGIIKTILDNLASLVNSLATTKSDTSHLHDDRYYKKEEIYTKAEAHSAIPLPAGMVVPFAGAMIPDGYLLCNGSEVSKAEYAALYSAIGDIYDNGASEGYFNLPDFRGMFLRGYGGSSENLGVVQSDSLKEHNHSSSPEGEHTHTRGTMEITGTSEGHNSWSGLVRSGLVGGAFTRVNYSGHHNVSSGGSDNGFYYDFAASRSWSGATSPDGSHAHIIGNTGEDETRPQNMAVNYLIKY